MGSVGVVGDVFATGEAGEAVGVGLVDILDVHVGRDGLHLWGVVLQHVHLQLGTHGWFHFSHVEVELGVAFIIDGDGEVGFALLVQDGFQRLVLFVWGAFLATTEATAAVASLSSFWHIHNL